MLTAVAVVLFGTSRLSHLTAPLTLIAENRLRIVKQLVCILEDIQTMVSELRNTSIFDGRSMVAASLETAARSRDDASKTIESLALLMRCPHPSAG